MDRGTEFIASTMKEVCDLLEIKQSTSTAYHHESLNAIENSHKALGAYLRMMADEKDGSWSEWVPFWCFSYNTTVHSETKYTSFELVFGRVCLVPGSVFRGVEPVYNFRRSLA